MKKVVVLVALFSLVASSAFAVIANSKHDLSVTGAGPNTSDYTETCVFCHTPHGAVNNTATVYSPLWNRSIDAVTVNSVYNSGATLSNVTTNVTVSDVQGTDLTLCLTCHDGTGLTDVLNNPANTSGNNPPVFTNTVMTSAAILDTDFDNDHPIAMNYAAVYADDQSDLVDPTALSSVYVLNDGEVWCSTCHDVHDGDNRFLVTTMAGSQLCLGCHGK